MMTPEQLLALDAARVWHPYDSVPPHAPPLLVQSALGVRLKLATEVYGHHELIDAMSSWWAVVHGYGNTVLNDALKAQVDEVSHLMMGGLTHEPAILLASKLVDIAPTGLERVFFSDSGSVAIEVAAKMSLQYWQALGHPQKQQFATWRGGYHGDTFLAMSLCDPDAGMHRDWRASVLPQVFMRRPPSGFTRCIDSDYIEHLTSTIRENASRLAAVVVEPILQGAGGMRFHNPAYLSVLREVTRECDVLLIFDEIATGFGRTGEIFAANFAGVSPDIMCVGKALTGGYLPMAATMCTQRVARGVGRDGGVLAHGPTFMGNPLAAAVACASIDLTIRDECRADVRRIERMLTSCLQSASDLDGVIDVRVLGAIAVLQLDHTVDADAASQAALATGVWLRPFGDVVYSLPPYVTADEDVEAICAAMIAAARASKRNQK